MTDNYNKFNNSREIELNKKLVQYRYH